MDKIDRTMVAHVPEGLTNKTILNYFLWGGRLARPYTYTKAGKMPTPQDWVIYLLSVPESKLGYGRKGVIVKVL